MPRCSACDYGSASKRFSMASASPDSSDLCVAPVRLKVTFVVTKMKTPKVTMRYTAASNRRTVDLDVPASSAIFRMLFPTAFQLANLIHQLGVGVSRSSPL
jgi:hypothetical protein